MRYWTGPGAGQGLYTGSQNDQGGLVLQLLSFLALTIETESRCKILRSNKPLVSLFTRRCGPFALIQNPEREKPPCEDGRLCPVSGIVAWIQQRSASLSSHYQLTVARCKNLKPHLARWRWRRRQPLFRIASRAFEKTLHYVYFVSSATLY